MFVDDPRIVFVNLRYYDLRILHLDHKIVEFRAKKKRVECTALVLVQVHFLSLSI